MKHSTIIKRIIALSCIAIFALACTTTTTKIKNPTFSIATDSMQLELNKIVSCENINLNGKEISGNGDVTTELEIDVTNGKNIPSDENQMNDLGKQIAKTIKNSLQDKNEFNTYRVLFISKSENNGMTKKEWKGKEFKSDEL